MTRCFFMAESIKIKAKVFCFFVRCLLAGVAEF